MILGDTEHLAFEYEPSNLSWGFVRLWACGELAWSTEDGKGVLWTWVDLVEHIARAWNHICFETNPPADVDEDAVYRYQHRHDLAAGLKGITLPSIWLFPTGTQMRVQLNLREAYPSREEILRTLAEFVEVVFAHVGDNDPRVMEARSHWQNRRL